MSEKDWSEYDEFVEQDEEFWDAQEEIHKDTWFEEKLCPVCEVGKIITEWNQLFHIVSQWSCNNHYCSSHEYD
jgi:hypothetical protein